MTSFSVVKNNINRFGPVKNSSYTLISVSFCKFLYGFYTAAIGSLLVPIGIAFNIDIAIQSVVFPFNYFGQIVIIFFVGYFADKLGKKIVHIVSLILLGISALFFNFIGAFYILLIFFFFMGLFGISINTIADATVSDSFKNQKGFYLNMAHVFFGLGALTSPIVFNFVFSLTGDFRTIYFILFIISFLILALIIPAKYPVVEDEKIKPKVLLDLLRNKKFLYLCFFGLFSAGSQHSVSGWIPTLFQKNLNISAEISNYALSFYWIAIVVGRIITAFLSRKFSEAILLRVMNMMMFFVLAASFFFNSYALLLADYLLFGLLLGGTFPLVIAYSAAIFPKYSTTRLAAVFSFSAIGMFVIPTIIGVLGKYFVIYKIISFTALSFLAYIPIFFKRLRD